MRASLFLSLLVPLAMVPWAANAQYVDGQQNPQTGELNPKVRGILQGVLDKDNAATNAPTAMYNYSVDGKSQMIKVNDRRTLLNIAGKSYAICYTGESTPRQTRNIVNGTTCNLPRLYRFERRAVLSSEYILYDNYMNRLLGLFKQSPHRRVKMVSAVESISDKEQTIIMDHVGHGIGKPISYDFTYNGRLYRWEKRSLISVSYMTLKDVTSGETLATYSENSQLHDKKVSATLTPTAEYIRLCNQYPLLERLTVTSATYIQKNRT
ncbi:MAG: hypothetical protein DHS80DRAFT_21301 [Piptocephalis tieghemiana]|nr:MAG: hypothetical protein DHS80DRAFT_21301 [Piptocephalis tieghemiana]